MTSNYHLTFPAAEADLAALAAAHAEHMAACPCPYCNPAVTA